jgi:MoaA/NifB/PqqE/SkfB family radical SAM enzyme
MEFRCNLRCTHCMIEGTMSHLRPTDDDQFEAVLQTQRDEGRWIGIVLTGAEITLRSDLPEIATRARDAGFQRIRVQTHGMQLQRRAYLDRLVEAGVTEFFVSVTAASEARHDAITKVSGSWRRMRAGLDLIETHYPELAVITNTVITAESFLDLPGVVAAFADHRTVVQHEFWNFFPMEEIDRNSLCVPLAEVMPPLRAAIAAAHAAGRLVEVKHIPECLLGNDRAVLINRQPQLIIDEDFWTGFDRNGFHSCPHRAICTSGECLGLTTAYVRRFGDEARMLRPFAEATTLTEPE